MDSHPLDAVESVYPFYEFFVHENCLRVTARVRVDAKHIQQEIIWTREILIARTKVETRSSRTRDRSTRNDVSRASARRQGPSIPRIAEYSV
jgi:hypothetical protein